MIKNYENHIAPIGFFFDFFPTDIFNIPIMPVPMRVDRIFYGEPSYFIEPNYEDILERDFELEINFTQFYTIGIKNLIAYANEKYKEINNKSLEKKLIKQWFKKSTNIQTEITTLNKDFTYIIIKFLEMINDVNKNVKTNHNSDYKSACKNYFENIINYIEKKLLDNEIEILYKGEITTQKIYYVKRKKYFPRIVEIDTINLENGKKTEKGFVAYLIYDDLLDIFNYNLKLINENKSNLFNYLNIENRRINKKINIFNNRKKISDKFFKIDNIKIENLI
ncbi:MAG: hypothetical protein EU549_04430 [Promethearchaeota archaeon]|nr:MAG: hypothetical protein EU549_04430 [Candidatus Lokiarchaeota archaeon]